MGGLTRFLRRFFDKTSGKDSEESPDALRSLFTARYLSFRALINANNNALQIMYEMEQALQGSQAFGMAFIRGKCTALSVNVYKIIQSLNEIAPGRYRELFPIFETIQGNLNAILEEHRVFAAGELVIPLKRINKDMADQAGAKMANLGEIMNRVGLPVPEGFVITASAYSRFMEHNGIQEEINRRIQPLRLEDMESLYNASADIQQWIIRSSLPRDLKGALFSAYGALEERTQKDIKVSLRSSALGEDTGSASFAGQYASRLNVSREFLAYAYKEILSSKYSPQAIAYRLNMGFRDEDIAMCVGCMAMVDALSSGVAYSRDPGNIRSDVVLINAVWGLAKSVVDGTVSPDLFVVSKASPGKILTKEIRRKDQKFVCVADEGVCRMALAGEEKDDPAIREDQALALANLAQRLEQHFGAPQDIEWTIGKDGIIQILQSRPLRQVDAATRTGEGGAGAGEEHPIIVKGGVTASPGVASSPAFLVATTVDVLRFPHGAVLVAENSLPQWAALLSRAAGVITDRGGVAGHLATVSREFGIPALFDAHEATSKIKTGDIITLDATGRTVYAGKVEALLQGKDIERHGIMKGSPVYTILERILQQVTPLTLTNPDAPQFRAKNCRTLHDITRFCHEKSVTEMFRFGKDHYFSERASKQLVDDIPMRWWVLDLQDGFKEPVGGDTVSISNIASTPMLAILEGLSAVPWKGPPPVDTRGFTSILFRSTMDPSLSVGGRSRYGEKNYFMISRNFCNLSCHFGYHFSSVEAYVHDLPKSNYVRFNFKGGAADYHRRVERVRLIERILQQFGFRVEAKGDNILARFEGRPRDISLDRLKLLGYLTMHTRQLDMVMANPLSVNRYMDQMLKDIELLISN
jgi:pyruvate, water dikinase